MGRFLGCGIATKIIIEKNNSWTRRYDVDVLERKDEILDDLSKMFDLSMYELNEFDSGYFLELKPDFFEKYIHELIKELSSLVDCCDILNAYCGDDDALEIIKQEKFIQSEYPLTIKKGVKYYEKKYYCEEAGICEELVYDPASYYLFNKEEFADGVDLGLYTLRLWQDVNKYVGEDPTAMLRIMNTMSRSHFKSPLSKCIVFHIFG